MGDETRRDETQVSAQTGGATGEARAGQTPPEAGAPAEGPGATRRSRRDGDRVLLDVTVPKRWLIGVVVALVAMLVVAVIAFAALNRIDTCAQCHVIEPEVTTYKETAHYAAGVVCQDCHTKPGVFNYFVRNLQGLTHFVNYASDTYQKPVTTYVGANNCVQCHSNAEIERDIVVGQIRVNHTGLREEGYQCLTCHANISHPGTQLEVARMPQDTIMSVCARCHDGERLPEDCDVCHVGALPTDHEKVAMTVRVTPSQCRRCHGGRTFCSQCHNGLQMPHPKSWQAAHGDVVVDRGKSVCASCHLEDDKRFCIDCHGLAMPHPGDWEARHDAAAAKDQQVCVRCHGKNSCIACHGLPMPHPAGFAQAHSSTYYNAPGACSRCHSSTYCSDCHGVSLPHGGSFIADHPNAVFANGAVCVKCHGNAGSGARGCYGGECHSGSIDD